MSYILIIYKNDRRYKKGRRLVKTYTYNGYSTNAMMNEIRYLQQELYKPSNGWHLDFTKIEIPDSMARQVKE